MPARENSERIPIIVLAGSDRRQGPTPKGAEDFHFVVGYKGADIRVGGRPLIQILVDRIRRSGSFGRVYVAGPERIYGQLLDSTIIDTDGSVDRNLLRAERFVRAEQGDDIRIGFIACDVLPSVEEISELASALIEPERSPGDSGEAPAPPALAIALCSCRAGSRSDTACGENLGASRWKPRYRFRLERDSEALPFLPAHLAVAWPARLRTGLFYRLLRLAYQERNRDFEHRKRAIVLRVLSALVWRDIMNVLRFRWPLLTWSVLRHGLGAFRRWRRTELDISALAAAIEGIAVRRAHRGRGGACSVRIVLTPKLSFAKDLDTREEIAELVRGATATREPDGQP